MHVEFCASQNWIYMWSATCVQGGPKVGIQYIDNYSIPTVYLLLAHPVFARESIWNPNSNPGTWLATAWQPFCLCFCWALFFHHLHLIALLFLQGPVACMFKKCNYFHFLNFYWSSVKSVVSFSMYGLVPVYLPVQEAALKCHVLE